MLADRNNIRFASFIIVSLLDYDHDLTIALSRLVQTPHQKSVFSPAAIFVISAGFPNGVPLRALRPQALSPIIDEPERERPGETPPIK